MDLGLAKLERTHLRYCKCDQGPVAREVKGPRGELSAVLPIGYGIMLSSKYASLHNIITAINRHQRVYIFVCGGQGRVVNVCGGLM